MPNLKTTPEALPCLVDKETLALFKKYEVLENEELVSRYHINLEAYCKTVNIESLLTANMARTMILPAALDYQQKVAQTIATTRAAVNGVNLSTQEHLLKELCEKICSLQSAIDKLESMVKEAHHEESGDHEAENLNRARFFEQKVIPAMNAVRAFADELELIVDDSLWPLPKFREMLYVY